MSQGHVNRGMMLVKAMAKRDRADFFDQLAGTYCVDCGEELPEDEDEEHDCPAAEEGEDEDEDDFGSAEVYDVIDAAADLANEAGASKVHDGKVLVDVKAVTKLQEKLDVLKLAEESEDDEDDEGEDGDPDEDDEEEDGDDDDNE